MRTVVIQSTAGSINKQILPYLFLLYPKFYCREKFVPVPKKKEMSKLKWISTSLDLLFGGLSFNHFETAPFLLRLAYYLLM